MVGIVIVSHSCKAAEGAAELALQMAPSAPVAAAGGLPESVRISSAFMLPLNPSPGRMVR